MRIDFGRSVALVNGLSSLLVANKDTDGLYCFYYPDRLLAYSSNLGVYGFIHRHRCSYWWDS
jgi:hypothetical protein